MQKHQCRGERRAKLIRDCNLVQGQHHILLLLLLEYLMEVRRNNRVCYIIKVDRNGRLVQEINTADPDLKIFNHFAISFTSFMILLQLKDVISLHWLITLSQHDLLKA